MIKSINRTTSTLPFTNALASKPAYPRHFALHETLDALALATRHVLGLLPTITPDHLPFPAPPTLVGMTHPLTSVFPAIQDASAR